MDKTDLLKLKTDIEAAKTKVSKLEGAKETLMHQLKTRWKCSTLEEAEKKVEDFKKKEAKLSKQLEDGLEELKTVMEEVK